MEMEKAEKAKIILNEIERYEDYIERFRQGLNLYLGEPNEYFKINKYDDRKTFAEAIQTKINELKEELENL